MTRDEYLERLAQYRDQLEEVGHGLFVACEHGDTTVVGHHDFGAAQIASIDDDGLRNRWETTDADDFAVKLGTILSGDRRLSVEQLIVGIRALPLEEQERLRVAIEDRAKALTNDSAKAQAGT